MFYFPIYNSTKQNSNFPNALYGRTVGYMSFGALRWSDEMTVLTCERVTVEDDQIMNVNDYDWVTTL